MTFSLEFLDVTSKQTDLFFWGGGIPKRFPLVLLRRPAVFPQTPIDHCLLVCPQRRGFFPTSLMFLLTTRSPIHRKREPGMSRHIQRTLNIDIYEVTNEHMRRSN